MSKISTVYQTLEDQENADYIEDHGPFPCKRGSAWLGNGYYFWDFHIELAHWWGEKAYAKNGHIVCEGKCVINSENCWDLHNEGEHRQEFIDTLDYMVRSKIVSDPNTVTVAQVIMYIRRKGFFNHDGIRVLGVNSAGRTDDFSKVGARLLFNRKKNAYYDLFPAIQICLLNKTSCSLRDYVIVWPEKYCAESVF
jgi:hypothetical protein